MPTGHDDERASYEVAVEGSTLIVRLPAGRLTVDQAQPMFDEVARRGDGEHVRAVIYRAERLESFEPGVVKAAIPSAQALGERAVPIVVVSESASVRFAIASVKLLVAGEIHAVETLDEACVKLGLAPRSLSA